MPRPAAEKRRGTAAPRSPRKAATIDSAAIADVQSPRQRSPGRSRSNASRVAILNATMKLLESQSLQRLSIEAIAREAGVGKTTIYRWWPSKAAVVIEAFARNHISHVTASKDMGPRDALLNVLQLLVEEYAGSVGRIVAQILAEGQSDPEVLREFRERFWYGRRLMALELIMEARRLGEIRDDVDPDFQLEILYGPVYLRLLNGYAPLDAQFAAAHGEAVMRLLQVPGNPGPAPVRRKSTKPKSR